MALLSKGLSTYIYNNNIKSVVLLVGFPFLIFMVAYLFLFLVYHFSPHSLLLDSLSNLQDTFTPHEKALNGLFYLIPWLTLGVGIWFLIAYTFHTRMINASTGARLITRRENPKIYNMLENLCITRGITMPQFQVIDSPALNAFASGINDKTYRITLTRGLIDQLQDDELEAVIAHELSHILNRDVRLMIISIIFVGIFSFATRFLFRSMMFGRRSVPMRYMRQQKNQNAGGQLVLFLIGLLVIGLGYFISIFIRFAISRRREYMADAGAVDLTKNPESMMRALMRISGKSKIDDMPENIKQMCIEHQRMNVMSLFATHPLIQDRIQAISDMTATPIPSLPVSLRRPPRRPWGE